MAKKSEFLPINTAFDLKVQELVLQSIVDKNPSIKIPNSAEMDEIRKKALSLLQNDYPDAGIKAN